ncbi:MAG: molybdate metabolism regulator, partial [Nonomuraea sp.]|nr:molybdate metabolism regulator [Nonomuraea sp.]
MTRTDEDLLVMPSAWLRALHPRRGGAQVPVKPPAPDAPAKLAALVAERRADIEGWLPGDPGSELTLAGRAYLAGEHTPLGAAVIARALARRVHWQNHTTMADVADGWLVEHGLPFAARAAAEFASLNITYDGVKHSAQRLRDAESADYQSGWHHVDLVGRVRAAIATAPDAEYAEVVAALTASRESGLHHRVAASFLAPTETGWVSADCDEVVRFNFGLALPLMSAVSTPEQAAAVSAHLRGQVLHSLAVPVTLIDALGHEAALPFLVRWFDDAWDGDSERRLLGVLAELPGDAPMRALLGKLDTKHGQPMFLRAATRFPRRAMRLLAESRAKAADALLRAHVLGHLDLVPEVVADLDPAAAERVGKLAAVAQIDFAPLEALPELLASPPWTRRRTAGKPTVIPGLACDDKPAVVWQEGERELWRSAAQGTHWSQIWNQTWSEVAAAVSSGQASVFFEIALFTGGPDKLADPLISSWRPRDMWRADAWMPSVAARFELAALPMLLASARTSPTAVAPALLPFAGPELAGLMADWLARLKSVRATALAWLSRHPDAAARALIPAALGRPGVERRQAEQAL